MITSGKSEKPSVRGAVRSKASVVEGRGAQVVASQGLSVERASVRVERWEDAEGGREGASEAGG